MAKKTPRRRSRRAHGNFKSVRYSNTLALGALAAFDVIEGDMIGASDSKYRLVSLDYNAAWNEIQSGIDGNCLFGVAHGDYTAAEIEECIEATASIVQGNKIANEQANRLVRVLGTISGVGAGGGSTDADSIFNDGEKMRAKLNWQIPIGITVVMWALNQSGAVWTTGSSLAMTGTAHVVYS